MKLSTKARYGIRAMLELAASQSEWPLALNAVAERQSIPEPYLEQLIKPLKAAGLVASTRGAQGGYRLARDAGEISVGQIIRALEGSLAPVGCVEDDDFCTHSDSCAMHILWRRVNAGLESLYDSIMLSEVAGDYAKQASACACVK